MGVPICGACRRPIEGRVVNAMGKQWHVEVRSHTLFQKLPVFFLLMSHWNLQFTSFHPVFLNLFTWCICIILPSCPDDDPTCHMFFLVLLSTFSIMCALYVSARFRATRSMSAVVVPIVRDTLTWWGDLIWRGGLAFSRRLLSAVCTVTPHLNNCSLPASYKDYTNTIWQY